MSVRRDEDTTVADRVFDVSLPASSVLCRGFQSYERFVVTIPRADDSALMQTRDILRGGHVVAVLPIDLARREVVLIRQFRLAAHLATGRGDMVEIVAGRLEDGEAPAACARRECVEEIGVAPDSLAPMFEMMATPGITDEHALLMVGFIDAGKITPRGGVAHEHEETRPFRVSIDEAIAALSAGRIANGFTIAALQWLALNVGRLENLARRSD
jgi:ADP-ribose pyrophosphatase